MILRAKQWIARRRHALGFGVHSPFAFSVVRNIVQERYAYYGYRDIERVAEQASTGQKPQYGLPPDLREARFLLRLCGRLGMSCISTDSDSPLVLAAVEAASAQWHKWPQLAATAEPGLIYLTETQPSAAVVAAHLRRAGNALLTHQRVADEALAAMPGGIVFESPRGTLAVSREGMSIVRMAVALPLACLSKSAH